ncbi:MAG TPA: hypothetical protein VGR81_03595 [Candidatus Acidoferrales bacterium]|nr:hypothetical protein [Candidatus Acidoferrales bacterium]
MKRGFFNQKLGKRNSRRSEMLKSKSFARPSVRNPRASKQPNTGAHPGR